MKVEPLFCTWIKNNIPNWEEVASFSKKFVSGPVLIQILNYNSFWVSIPVLQCIVVSPDEGGAKRCCFLLTFVLTII